MFLLLRNSTKKFCSVIICLERNRMLCSNPYAFELEICTYIIFCSIVLILTNIGFQITQLDGLYENITGT